METWTVAVFLRVSEDAKWLARGAVPESTAENAMMTVTTDWQRRRTQRIIGNLSGE